MGLFPVIRRGQPRDPQFHTEASLGYLRSIGLHPTPVSAPDSRDQHQDGRFVSRADDHARARRRSLGRRGPADERDGHGR
jgi:hypothetical protein